MTNLDALHWHKARFPSADQFRHELSTLYLAAAPHYDNRVPPIELLAKLLNCAADAYAREFPAEYKPEHKKKLADPHKTYKRCLELFLASLVGFTRSFPHRHPIGQRTSPLFSIPVSPLTDDFITPSLAALDLVRPFSDSLAERAQLGLFQGDDFAPYAWRASEAPTEPRFEKSEPIFGDQYERRAWRAEKRAFEETDVKWWKERRAEFDAEHKLVHEETPPWTVPLIDTPYFPDGLTLAQPVQVPFEIPEERWFEGSWIIAPQGRGKTNLLRHLILNVQPDASVILFDAKGELTQSLSKLARFKDRLVFLDPKFPLALNPLDIGGHSIELLEYVFSTILESPLTPLQATLFRLTLTLIVSIPHATLETFREIIQQKAGWRPYEAYVRKLSKRDQDFFDLEFDTDTYKKTKQEVLWRLRTLMSVPSLDAMFQSAKTKVDIASLMNSGKFVCINNNYEDLGDQGAEFFGRFFIAMIWNAARKRTKLAESEKRPVYVFIDEAHYVIARDPKIATILQQCRAQKIAIVFAHQELQQIKSDDVRSALTNCAIKFANSTGDAHELAARFDASPEFLKAQKRGSFACYVRDKTETGISLSVPLVDLVLYDTLTPDEVQELVAASRAAYGQYERPPEQVASDKDSSLYWEITISPHLARAGGRRQIRTPRGAIEFMVPTNTIDGSKLRLRGCGMLMPDQSWGDLILTLKVPPMPRTGSPALLPVEDPREWG